MCCEVGGGACSSQFAENVSPRSNRSIHGVPPSVNEPVRSRIHELTSVNYAQPKLTVTLIPKLCIHEICTIHCSFNSLSPICHISNIDRIVVEKHQLSAFFGCIFKAALSILKISQIKDQKLKERCILHVTYIYLLVIEQILADLIRPSFYHFCQCHHGSMK